MKSIMLGYVVIIVVFMDWVRTMIQPGILEYFPIIAVFPFIGSIINLVLPRKAIVILLIISLLLLSPIFLGYKCLVGYIYESLIIIALGCLSSFLYNTIDGKILKIITGVSASIILFIVLMIIGFISAFGWSVTVRQTWDIDKNCKVEYMETAGFSGRHSFTYRLDKIGIVPIYVREIESVRENDTAQDCNVFFGGNNLIFNKCTGQLTKMNTKDMFIKLNQN